MVLGCALFFWGEPESSYCFVGEQLQGDTREACRRKEKKEKVIFLQDGTEGFVVKQMLLQWLFCTDGISCQSVKVGSVEQSDGQSILRGTRANFSFTTKARMQL